MDSICQDCIETHDQRFGRNYEWLDVLGRGRVELVWFCEPADSKEYVLYTPKWWEKHCEVISHGKDLYISHVRAFVNPKTRFAKMVFLFEDRSLLEADESFFRLEQQYYYDNGLCQ